jgi:hypothetical protein
MFCRSCGKQVADNAEICMSCGVKPLNATNFCQSCGASTTSEQELCVKCGVRLKTLQQDTGTSTRSKQTAMVCCALQIIGLGGIHRLYTGHTGIGIVQLLTWGGCWIWQIVDFVTIAGGTFRDAEGRLLK